MWFWSVSWSTNCSVYFSFFLVNQFFFWLTKNKFGRPKKKLVDQKHEKMVFGWPKKKLVDQKNEKLVFGRPKKKLVDQKNVKLTGQLVDQRDWPKVHGRRYTLWRIPGKQHYSGQAEIYLAEQFSPCSNPVPTTILIQRIPTGGILTKANVKWQEPTFPLQRIHLKCLWARLCVI